MNFLADEAIAWLASYFWPLCRITGMVGVMVGFGAKFVPMRTRLLLSVAITLLCAPLLPAMPAYSLFSLQSVLIILQQLLIGIAVGFVTVMLVQTFVLAGQVLAMQTSLGFASMVDPMNGQSVPVIGQLYVLLTTLLFFAVDGHLWMITTLVHSFTTIPVSMQGLAATDYQQVANFFGVMFAAALSMALAAIVALLTINFTFGIMTRAAPQLNIFSIGFSISMLFGLLILWLTIDVVLLHFENQWQNAAELICNVLKGAC